MSKNLCFGAELLNLKTECTFTLLQLLLPNVSEYREHETVRGCTLHKTTKYTKICGTTILIYILMIKLFNPVVLIRDKFLATELI